MTVKLEARETTHMVRLLCSSFTGLALISNSNTIPDYIVSSDEENTDGESANLFQRASRTLNRFNRKYRHEWGAPSREQSLLKELWNVCVLSIKSQTVITLTLNWWLFGGVCNSWECRRSIQGPLLDLNRICSNCDHFLEIVSSNNRIFRNGV